MNQPTYRFTKNLFQKVFPKYQSKIIAIYLTGSIVNSEESYDQKGKLTSDLDIMLVSKKNYFNLSTRIEEDIKKLNDKKLEINIGIIPLNNFKNHKSTIFFQVKKRGILLAGKDIKNLISMDKCNQISRWDGLRLILNRSMDFSYGISNKKNLKYNIARLYLSLGEAILLTTNNYPLSYKEIMNKIQHIKIKRNNLINKIKLAYNHKLNNGPFNINVNETIDDFFYVLDWYMEKNKISSLNKLKHNHFLFKHGVNAFIKFFIKFKCINLNLLFNEPIILTYQKNLAMLKSKNFKNFNKIYWEWKNFNQLFI